MFGDKSLQFIKKKGGTGFCFAKSRNPPPPPGGGRYSHTLPVRVCAAQRGRDFEAPDLEWGIHFRGIF